MVVWESKINLDMKSIFKKLLIWRKKTHKQKSYHVHLYLKLSHTYIFTTYTRPPSVIDRTTEIAY